MIGQGGIAGALALAVACLCSFAATAQLAGDGPRRIGVLSPVAASSAAPFVTALRDGLRALGWNDGGNVEIEIRHAEGRIERLPVLAAELVRARVHVLVAGSNPGVAAAKRASDTIPIVMVTTGDPVADGLVEAIARPGGNVTGVTATAQELSGKRLQLLKEAIPGLKRVAVLVNPDSPYTARYQRDAAAAAAAVGVDLHLVKASTADDFLPGFVAMRRADAQALMVLADILFISQRARLVALAAEHRMPAVYWERSFVSAGGLMFYGAGLPDMYRHAAKYVDRILRGARPADLPIEQPTKIELVINLQAAKDLALSLPDAILARADEVIE